MIFQSLVMIKKKEFTPVFWLWKTTTKSPRKIKKYEAQLCNHEHDEQVHVPSFIKIVQTVKKLNSISRAQLNFRRGPICVQLCIEISCKQATLVARLTNFSFEFFMKFSQKMRLYFFYTMVQKVIIIIFIGWTRWKRRKLYFSYETTVEKKFSPPTPLGENFLRLSAALARLSSIRGSLTCMESSAFWLWELRAVAR